MLIKVLLVYLVLEFLNCLYVIRSSFLKRSVKLIDQKTWIEKHQLVSKDYLQQLIYEMTLVQPKHISIKLSDSVAKIFFGRNRQLVLKFLSTRMNIKIKTSQYDRSHVFHVSKQITIPHYKPMIPLVIIDIFHKVSSFFCFQQRIPCCDGKIRLLTMGNNQVLPYMVFVCGLGLGHLQYLYFLRGLAKDANIIVVEFQHAICKQLTSQAPNFEDSIPAIHKQIQYITCDKPCLLMGHSFGTLVTNSLVCTYPEAYPSLVSVDNICNPFVTPFLIRAFRRWSTLKQLLIRSIIFRDSGICSLIRTSMMNMEIMYTCPPRKMDVYIFGSLDTLIGASYCSKYMHMNNYNTLVLKDMRHGETLFMNYEIIYKIIRDYLAMDVFT